MPPKLFLRFFHWYCHPKLVDHIEGDLLEDYGTRLRKSGKRKADIRFVIDVMLLFRPGIIRPTEGYGRLNNYGMISSYFKIAWRSITGSKVYSLVNILSVAVGMGVCLLICQYVYFELSYDTFHDSVLNTYRVVIDKTQNGVEQGSSPYTTHSFGESAKEEIPEVSQFTRVYRANEAAIVTNPETNIPINEDAAGLFFVDKSFLRVFNFPLALGNAESALNARYNLIITEGIAAKYFNSQNPIGKTLNIDGGHSPGTYTVTGVLKTLPVNSHLQFDFLMPMENFWVLGNGGSVSRYGGWVRPWFGTYLTLKGSTDIELVSKKLDQLIVKHRERFNQAENVQESVQLQPIADIHLRSGTYATSDFVNNNGSIRDVQIFSIVASFILFIAWVNYINLSTARSMRRAKEVGIRKSIGAVRRQLIGQFMTESLLINTVSGIISLGIASLLLPILSSVIGIQLELDLLRTSLFWVCFPGVIVFGSLLSGLYPAFVLSAFNPISMLRKNSSPRIGNFNLRKGLIVFQFVTSILLITATYLVYEQVTFMKNSDLGMDLEKILVVRGPQKIADAPKVSDGTNMDQVKASNAFNRSLFQTFVDKAVGHHSISAVTGSTVVPGQVHNTLRSDIRRFGQPKSQGMDGRLVNVGLDFLKAYDLQLLAGSFVTDGMVDDRFAVINEEAVNAYGFRSPENAIKQKVVIGDSSSITIVGVVKNFHWQSLRDPYTPFVLRYNGAANKYISFRVTVKNIGESLKHVKSTFEATYPGNPLEYFFLEDDFNKQYRADVQFGSLFLAFSSLAIFIACIGLFALVTFSATLRTKEIGIRKVLGSSVSSLIALLSREYLVLVLIANVIAIPAILYWGSSWLESFAFRTALRVQLFLFPGVLVFLMSMLIVGCRTYFAANVNPVDSLKAQ